MGSTSQTFLLSLEVLFQVEVVFLLAAIHRERVLVGACITTVDDERHELRIHFHIICTV